MKQETLLEALSYVNCEYIEAAAPKARPRRRLRPWLAAAACLALAVGVFAAARLAKPDAKPEAVPQGPSPYEAAENGPGEGPDKSDWPEPNADAQTILDYRIGGLYLGMPQREVLDLLGEPAEKGDPYTFADGSARKSWGYKLSEARTTGEDFYLGFADEGDGWVLNEILCYENCTIELPHGIRMGMTNAELLAVWPELETEFSVDGGIGEVEMSKTGQEIEHYVTSYSQYHAHLGFGIILEDDALDFVRLGTYYEEPPWDEEYPYPEPNADAQTILDYRIGGLYLGMPQQEVLDLLGEPTDRYKGDPVILEDGSARDTWWYKRSGDPERLSDFQVQFADKGDGWVVNEIMVYNDFDLSLPHGIRIGMTQDELLSVWPEITAEAAYNADAGGGVENGNAYSMTSYTQSNGVQWFNVDLKNGAVCSVYLGPYYKEPPWDLDAPTPEEPYSFSSGEITVWRRTDSGWEAVRKTERGAKLLETVFSIEELVPLEREPDEICYVADFQNGTVCLVCAPEEGITAGPNVPPDAWGGVYRLEDRDAFEASMIAGDTVPQGLSPLERCIFPYGTWDALGEAFE